MPLDTEKKLFSASKEPKKPQGSLEREKEERIRKEARIILDKFAKALEKVETKESSVEREESYRKERGDGGDEPDESFRQIFFQNAPEVNNECIQAEKGKWK